MKYIVNTEEISMIVFFIKYLLIDISTYYMFLKLSNQKNSIKINVIAMIGIIIVTYLYTIMQGRITPMDSMILLIIFITIIFIANSKRPMGTTIIITVGSLSISYSLFFIATFLNSIPNIVLHTQNDLVIISTIGVTYLILFLIFIKNKRLKMELYYRTMKNIMNNLIY